MTYYQEALALLKELISIQSFSKEEEGTAECIANFLTSKNVPINRKGNNVWCANKHFHPDKPTILLNSHHDTVKPNQGYTLDPFQPITKDGKLFGLGSNDAGGCLVSLCMTFLHFFEKENLPFNLLYAATAEEENSGKGGVESIVRDISPISFGIVGEPTQMEMSIAEKGLMVLDCTATGIAGHAARDVGVNAIYKAVEAIDWFRNYTFDKVSKYLGPIKMSVTVIKAGTQHNVVPDQCHFVVDIRTTDAYSNEETLEIIKQNVAVEVSARSTRLKPSGLPENHVLRKAAESLKITTFGSPTTSDQAVMDFATIKMGPGDSERSHTADEFIYLEELEEGIDGYIKLLEEVFRIVEK